MPLKRFFCTYCEVVTKVDEDGCCSMCGTDVEVDDRFWCKGDLISVATDLDNQASEEDNHAVEAHLLKASAYLRLAYAELHGVEVGADKLCT